MLRLPALHRPAVQLRFGALAALVLAAGCADPDPALPGGDPPQSAEREPLARSVLLLTVDTLRADALGCYGNAEARTPAIDRLASQSLLFERAYSQATITHPALSSALTGLLPVRHGVHTQAARLQGGAVSAAQLARAAGLRTGSFVANLCKLQDQPSTVFHDGWEERFCGMDDEQDQYLWDAAVVDAALEWLAADDAPFFAWVHLMDPHAEHRPAPDLWDYEAQPLRSKQEQYEHYGVFERERRMLPEDERQRLEALYAAEVAGVDRQVARLLDGLERKPDSDEIAVVFGSDHGEELFETWSRYDHGLSMTEGVLWVPLLVRAPGIEPSRFERPVELLSVAPTLLELLDLRAPRPLDGPSLLAAAELERDFALSFAGEISVSVRTGTHRYWLRRTPEPYVRAADEFPWRADAPWFQERECLAEYPESPTRVRWLEPDGEEHGPRARRMRAEMERFAKTVEAVASQSIDDPELEAQLRELGYAEGEL